MSRPSSVFLSYDSADIQKALKLRKCLTAEGISVWMAGASIKNGPAWIAQIGKAIRSCDWFIVLVTPAPVTSRWVKLEVQEAFLQPGLHDRISAIVHQGADPDLICWVLKHTQLLKWSSSRPCHPLLRGWDPTP